MSSGLSRTSGSVPHDFIVATQWYCNAMPERIPAWANVASGLVLAALLGAIEELLRELGSGVTDHLGIFGSVIEWRWTTLVILVFILFISASAYATANRDRFDPRGSSLMRTNRPIKLLSDGIEWVFEGFRRWPNGDEVADISPRCQTHEMPLLFWNGTYGPQSIYRAYGQSARKCKLYCPGAKDGEGHQIKLAEHKTLDAARSVAASRLQVILDADSHDHR